MWEEKGDFSNEGVVIIHRCGENGQNDVAVCCPSRGEECTVEIDYYGSRLIEVEIKVALIDISNMQIYMYNIHANNESRRGRIRQYMYVRERKYCIERKDQIM